MADQRIAGIIQLQVDGEVFAAKGAFEYNLGHPKREAVMGADGVHGYKETPQVPFISGAVTDRSDLDVKALVTMRDVTVTLALANRKTIVLGEAWYAGDGNVSTEEGEIEVRFEGSSPAKEIRNG